MQTTILAGRYLIIMGTAFIASFISILFGAYYLVKAIYFGKMSTNYNKLRHYYITAINYIVLVPILVLVISHNFLAPHFGTSKTPIEAKEGLIIESTQIIHQTDPLHIYIGMIALAGVIYWIRDHIKIRKQSKKDLNKGT